MSKEHHTNAAAWESHIGEAAGAKDHRVELLTYRGSLEEMLEIVSQDLDSAFPTIADTQLRPRILRAMEIIDELVSDAVPPPERAEMLEEELGHLEIEMMRGMRDRTLHERDVKGGAIFGGGHGASEDHSVIIPENWEKNIQ